MTGVQTCALPILIAIRVATLISAMQREKIDYGMVTMCIGTGMGAAGVIKKC